jgi:peptidoglycan/LPS O-acetylase OafA/YrhL
MINRPVLELGKPRLVGIDLFRGVAAYAVTLIHTSSLMLYAGLKSSNWTVAVEEMSRFAVPFFLALSFYLMTKNLYTSNYQLSLASIFKSRAERLLVPYFYWSLIYFSLKIVKTLLESRNIHTLFQDIVLLVFLGGASIHLYFLPLLFVGSFLILWSNILVKKRVQLKNILILLIISIFIYELQILSGNGFQFYTKFGVNCLESINSCSIAFQSLSKLIFTQENINQILRLLLVIISWLIKCWPYMMIAMIMNHPNMVTRISISNKKWILFFIGISIFISLLRLVSLSKGYYFPESIYEIGTAFSLLLSGISLSSYLPNRQYIKNLGVCSFGIYLIHYLILTLYMIFIGKLSNYLLSLPPLIIMIFIATITFFTSWFMVFMLMKIKPISKILFQT